jgi:hypothetical protein
VLVGVQAKTAPGFGDDDAVAGVMGVVANLDGQIDANVADVFGEQGNILGALIGDPRNPVGVDEDRWDRFFLSVFISL